CTAVRRCSLDDQVAHLGAGGSGEDDPSAVENRQQRDALRGVVEGRQQIDETCCWICRCTAVRRCSLDDQVAHLGAGGSGEDDPSAVENR
ncbi:hypothetical protein C7E18_22760, partial [Stenotrophomonas maltophilia]